MALEAVVSGATVVVVVVVVAVLVVVIVVVVEVVVVVVGSVVGSVVGDTGLVGRTVLGDGRVETVNAGVVGGVGRVESPLNVVPGEVGRAVGSVDCRTVGKAVGNVVAGDKVVRPVTGDGSVLPPD